MSYLVLQGAPELRYGNYVLRPVRQGDAEMIRVWRNDQLAVLRQSRPLSYSEQQAYFVNVVRPDFAAIEPDQILLILQEAGTPVAYGGLTHIDWRSGRAEVSFLTPRGAERYAMCFGSFLAILIPLAFDFLGLHRLWHETYGRPEIHAEVLVEAGFVREGTLLDHYYHETDYLDSVIFGLLEDDRIDPYVP